MDNGQLIQTLCGSLVPVSDKSWTRTGFVPSDLDEDYRAFVSLCDGGYTESAKTQDSAGAFLSACPAPSPPLACSKICPRHAFGPPSDFLHEHFPPGCGPQSASR